MSEFNFDLGPLVNTTTDRVKDIINNPYVYTTLVIFLTVYGSLAAPKLPESITSWFENPLVQVGVFFMIAYLSTKNQSVAIITAVVLAITLQTQIVHRLNKALMDALTGFSGIAPVMEEAPMEALVMEEAPMEQAPMEEAPMEVPVEQAQIPTGPIANDISVGNLSTAVGDEIGLMNDYDSKDYMMGYDRDCPGKFDRDIVNPNNQYSYEDAFPGNMVSPN
jgi:hypothetical protein